LVGGLGFWLLTRYRGLVVLKPRSVALPTSDESSDALDYEMLGRFSSVCSDDTGDGFDGEHPQTLALMLARIPSAQAAEIMVRLPSELRAEVARRISDLDDADPDVLAEIRRDLARRTDSPEVTTLSGNDESGNGDYQRAERDALRLLAFEDIMLLGAGELRVAMGAVEPDDLAISLRMAARPVRRKVLGCLSSRDAEYVQTRMDRIGPMRICDVESARQRVMKTVSQAAGPARRPGQTAHGDALEEAV
ncbi:MAG: hypothetical protein GY794_24975, partial [bacterium]|nr:hypothetical protein [bacterium]